MPKHRIGLALAASLAAAGALQPGAAFAVAPTSIMRG